MYYRRNLGAMKEWKDEEKTILERHYATISIPDLMALLPDRTLYSIRSYAKTHDLTRQHKGNTLHISLNDSYKDWEFENSKGIYETSHTPIGKHCIDRKDECAPDALKKAGKDEERQSRSKARMR